MKTAVSVRRETDRVSPMAGMLCSAEWSVGEIRPSGWRAEKRGAGDSRNACGNKE